MAKLLTAVASKVLEQITPELRDALVEFGDCRFDPGQKRLVVVRQVIASARAEAGDSEDLLTDLFVLDSYLDLLSTYGSLWEEVLAEAFSSSWRLLQDALDLLRVIKRFSVLDVSFFENQLLELEQAYPYKIFSSIAVVVSRFECSICGKDIDSDECPHRRGHLYRGKMAYGIARDIVAADHVALVRNPDNKRCVIEYENTGPQFSLVRYVSQLISSGQLRISDFTRLHRMKRRRSNPAYVQLQRNDKCFCGSGKKFKKCCISRRQIEEDHVDVISERRDIRDAVV